jgi:hypothetical protein
MNPLPAQKIEFGVKMKNDEIVGEKQQPTPEKGVNGGGSWRRGIKRAHSAFFLSAGRLRNSPTHFSPHTDAPLRQSQQEHLRYCLSTCTSFS